MSCVFAFDVLICHGACPCFVHSFQLRPETSSYSEWEANPTTSLGDKFAECAWRVPDGVLELIPQSVKLLLGIVEGQAFVVIRNIHVLDICAGRARICKWAHVAKLTSIALDREYGDHLDINSDSGLAIAIVCLLRVRDRGLAFIAAQCSSWVWINRMVSKRNAADTHGDTAIPSVREGNMLNSRVGLLCVMAFMIGVRFVIEQPSASLFFQTPLMGNVIAYTKAVSHHIYMQGFGHPSKKGTRLVGTAEWLPQLKAPPAKKTKKGKVQKGAVPLYSSRRRADGSRATTGCKKAMKNSQVYPAAFALAVVKANYPEFF